MRLLVAALMVGAALSGAAPSHAEDILCHITYMNNNRDSYEYCYWMDQYRNRSGTVTTCFGATGYCLTRDLR